VLTRPLPVAAGEGRHRTLRMTFDWSYDLLTKPQRTLAQRLSVFAGGFRMDAVGTVCGDDLDVFDCVDELVAKSLVTFDGTTARYQLLEPLRQYLAERLDETGATEEVRRAHAEWVAGLCERLGTRLLEDQKARSSRLREETDNIELALHWAHDHDSAVAVRIVGSLGQYWFSYDQASGRRWCEPVIGAGADVSRRSWARALLSAGMVAENDQDWSRAATLLEDALAIFIEEGSPTGQAAALYRLGIALTFAADPEYGQDRPTDARQCLEESVRLFTQVGNSLGAGWCGVWLSWHAYWNDDLDQSEQLAKQVVERCSAAGALHPTGRALCNLAFVARRRGHDDAALQFLQDAEALYRELDDPRELVGVLPELAEQEATMGRGAEALQALAEATRLDEQIARLPVRTESLALAALVHLARGDSKMSILALGAYDAHPCDEARGPRGILNPGSLANAVLGARGQLNAAEVVAAATAARHKSVNELIDELIIRPALQAV
jgi:tetratricopeptide (TPR) repeat protein